MKNALCIVISLFFFAGVALAQTPDVNWNLTTTAHTQNFINDCTGAANQSNDATFGTCQSFDTDLYETLDSAGNGFCDSDLSVYRVSSSSTFFYFEIELFGSWDACGGGNVGETHHYVLEVDVDPLTEARYDFMFVYDIEESHIVASPFTWQDHTGDKIKSFYDEDDNVGCSDVDSPDDCSPDSQYDNDFDPGDSFYARVIERSGKRVVQIAIKRNVADGGVTFNPTRIRSRVWSAQSSTIDKAKLPFHDTHTISDLGSEKIDNICGADPLLCPESGDGLTPVTLSFFRTTGSGGAIKFEWSSVNEVGNVGYHIYAETANGLQKITDRLVASKQVDSLTPRNYNAVLHVPGGTRAFYIADVDTNAQTVLHGPFELGQSYGRRGKPEPVDWATIGAEHEALGKERAKGLQKKIAAENQAATTTGFAVEMAVATSTKTKFELQVNKDGIHRVTYDQLKSAGLDWANVAISSLAVTVRGVAVPINVKGSNAKPKYFGPGGYIEFYGKPLDTLYTKTNVYVLQVNAKLAKRIGVNNTLAAKSATPAKFYMETITVDTNSAYHSASPNGDPWYNTGILAFTSPVSKNFNITVDNLVSNVNASSQLNLGLWGVTNWPGVGQPDHHIKATLNGTEVGDHWADGLVDLPLNFTLPAGLLKNGANTVTVTVPGDTGFDYDLVHHDRHGVTYPRAFQARNGRLSFNASGAAFKVNGLPSSNIVVYRVEGAKVTQLTGLKIVQAASGNYSVTFRGLNTAAQYYVSTAGGLYLPGLAPQQPYTEIKTGAAKLLIIAHPNFISGVQTLANARKSQGYSVKVVNVFDIYAQYSHGITDPTAIRKYIKHAAANLATQYVLLVGGDTYDYFNYLGLGSVSFIPTLYTRIHDTVHFSASDPLYADTNNDRIPDLAIGRLPVRTTTELNSVVQKILQYPNAGHWRTAVFAADRGESMVSFAVESNALANKLPGGWAVDRAYLDNLGLNNSRSLLINSINQGRALTTFFGHSGLTVWTFENLFTATDAAALTNSGKPTVVTQYGCWNTYHVSPHYETMAHKLLLSGDRGAAAVLGAATITEALSDRILGRAFFDRLFQPGQTIGSALQQAKSEVGAGNPQLGDVLLGWTLLGDPTMVVEP